MLIPNRVRSTLVRAAPLAFAFVVWVLAGSCGGGGDGDSSDDTPTSAALPGTEQPGTITIPQGALEALDEYAFTSQIEMSSDAGHLEATFDAQFQAPDRIQGTLTATGEGYETLSDDFGVGVPFDLPLETEVLGAGGGTWVRQTGEDWQAADAGEQAGPYVDLLAFASPPTYLTIFRFDSLRLPVAGPAETVNGVRALPVRLDKAALIALLGQGTVCPGREELPCTPPWSDTQQQAQEELPADIVVATWIAEEGSYPARIIITFSLAEGREFFIGLRPPQSVRLQMDITDTDVDVQIEPPPQE